MAYRGPQTVLAVKVKLEGADELIRQLAAAGGNVKKTVRAASLAGGKVIRAEADARVRATVKSSVGKRVISAKASFPRRDVCEVKLAFTKREWALRFIELGVSPREIVGKPLVFEGRNGLIVTGGVHHPGQPARPMLRPAFDAKRGEAVEVMGEVLRQAVVEARIAQAAADDED